MKVHVCHKEVQKEYFSPKKYVCLLLHGKMK